jgi:hypothetical protein
METTNYKITLFKKTLRKLEIHWISMSWLLLSSYFRKYNINFCMLIMKITLQILYFEVVDHSSIKNTQNWTKKLMWAQMSIRDCTQTCISLSLSLNLGPHFQKNWRSCKIDFDSHFKSKRHSHPKKSRITDLTCPTCVQMIWTMWS